MILKLKNRLNNLIETRSEQIEAQIGQRYEDRIKELEQKLEQAKNHKVEGNEDDAQQEMVPKALLDEAKDQMEQTMVTQLILIDEKENLERQLEEAKQRCSELENALQDRSESDENSTVDDESTSASNMMYDPNLTIICQGGFNFQFAFNTANIKLACLKTLILFPLSHRCEKTNFFMQNSFPKEVKNFWFTGEHCAGGICDTVNFTTSLINIAK